MPMPGAPKFLMCDALIPLPNGRTRLEVRIAPADPKDKPAIDQMLPMIEPIVRAASEHLARMIDEELAKRPTAGADEEPTLPVSEGRFASDPVARAIPGH
jgi:hypothetical protein